MDYIVMSRKDYIAYKTQKLSPESKEYAGLMYYEEFSRLQKFVADQCEPYKLPLYKRIGLIAAFALMIVGVTSIIVLAFKCLFG